MPYEPTRTISATIDTGVTFDAESRHWRLALFNADGSSYTPDLGEAGEQLTDAIERLADNENLDADQAQAIADLLALALNARLVVVETDLDTLDGRITVVETSVAEWEAVVGPEGPQGPAGDDGATGADGPLPSRQDAVVVTASLVLDANETGDVTLAPGFRLIKVATSGPARVQLYTRSIKRAEDASRVVGEDPTGNHGVILDLVTTNEELAWELSPQVLGSHYTPGTDGIPYRVTNLGGTGPVTVTFTFTPEEP